MESHAKEACKQSLALHSDDDMLGQVDDACNESSADDRTRDSESEIVHHGGFSRTIHCVSRADVQSRLRAHLSKPFLEGLVNVEMHVDTETGKRKVHPFQDLATWRNSLKQMLLAAQTFMIDAQDCDLADEVGRMCKKVTELTRTAVKVLASFASAGHILRTNMLPYLEECHAKGKKARAANVCGAVQGVLHDLTNQAAAFRSLYSDIFAKVGNVMRCTHASLDFYHMKVAESEVPISSEDQHEIVMLRGAAFMLYSALLVMDQCSVSFLLVDDTQSSLDSLKATSLSLYNELVISTSRVWPTCYLEFYAGIKKFCEQYCSSVTSQMANVNQHAFT